MPPEAAAKKKVAELGMPSMSVMRPAMFAGPIGRHRNAASSVESRVRPPREVVEAGGGAGGAGGFWDNSGAAARVRTAAAAQERVTMTASENGMSDGYLAANGVRTEGVGR